MKKLKVLLVIGILVIAIIVFYNLFSGKRCTYCESRDVKYESFFVPAGTVSEYLCEDCYQEMYPYPDYWIIRPVS